MTITRANAESILYRRTKGYLSAANMDETYAGANPDMNDPLGYALRQCDLSVSNASTIADADIANVTDALLDQFLDLAELRLLESIAGNLEIVDTTTGPVKYAYGQIGARLEKKLERLKEKIEKQYGIGLAGLEFGVINMNFAEHMEERSTSE